MARVGRIGWRVAAQRGSPHALVLVILIALATPARARTPAQQAGSIRGTVYDADFDVPLPGAHVLVVESGQAATTGDGGHFVIGAVAPGTYTLVFTKDGYLREVEAGVTVRAGALAELDVELVGEFTEMDEFVVQDVLQLGAGSEAALLELRFESPALLDSIGADLLSRAGASDAASGLRLVSGASVQDGKFAVIRGLPDRYVSSQMNGVRLPTADEDKRAVELDQFPAAVIESLQVSKTFTPDQQGDASGGAVDVRLRGIPEETVLSFKAQYTWDSQASGSDFLTYDGGGVSFLGTDDGERDVQTENLGGNWSGAAGVSRGEAPAEYKWSLDAGTRKELDNGLVVGGFASLFYERDASFYDDGVDDSWWVANPGEDLTPQTSQGTPNDGDFKTSLFDVTQGEQSVQWGGLGTLGVASERHALDLTYLYTHIAEDVATLAEDTRGKEYFFPGYDPDDPAGPGNNANDRRAAPYLRTETLEYTERTTGTLQLHGEHELPLDPPDAGDALAFGRARLDWFVATSFADMDQPDKRQFGSLFLPESFNPALPGVEPPLWIPFKPGANFTYGNFQRIFKTIEETSDQYGADLAFPFEQWSGSAGALSFGVFSDHVEREFVQETFSNFGEVDIQFDGDFDDFWSDAFPDEDHAITESLQDVDYDGDQRVQAAYGMLDMPLASWATVVGGARFESTSIDIVNFPEEDATWFEPGATQPVGLEPGEADVAFEQDDVLPSIGLELVPHRAVTLRASYAETVARQTFKELTPIVQQEYLGGPVFIGNPELGMSALENWDLRVDYRPAEGSLVSASWFAKDVDDPIEYVQQPGDFTYTTARNYPEGELTGWELEVRQSLGRFAERLEGVSLGANATFLDSEVRLPQTEIDDFAALGVPRTSRDMTGAPEHLFNVYATYDTPDGWQLALFYTLEGDTLVAGAGESSGNFVPDVYSKQYGTLNLSVSKRVGEHLKLAFTAKNLTDPEIEEVYRSEFISDDVTKTSYSKGAELSFGLSVNL